MDPSDVVGGVPSSSSMSVPPAAAAAPILNFPVILSTLLQRVAAGGLEGRSLHALFDAHEYAEQLRLREVSLAIRCTTGASTDVSDPAIDPSHYQLDPFVRFHLVRLLRERVKEVEFVCKQPQVLPQELIRLIGTMGPTASPVNVPQTEFTPPSPPAALLTDSKMQLAYIRALCASLQEQQAQHPHALLSGGYAPVVSSDQTLLDESLAGKSGWIPTGQGLIHVSSLNRITLLPQTLEAMNPEELHVLSTSLVLVAKPHVRYRFLGLSEDDVEALKAFTGPAAKQTTLPPLAEQFGPPFVLLNILETIGKFSVQMPVPPPVSSSTPFSFASSSSSSSAVTNHAGLFQTHLAKIMKLTSGSVFRFLLILETKGLITPIRVTDDLKESSLGAGWRWFLVHYAPSLHAAARANASMQQDTPFSSLGTLTADLPLQAFQAATHNIHTFFRQSNWKTFRKKLRAEREKELARVNNQQQQLQTARRSSDQMELDGEEDSKPQRAGVKQESSSSSLDVASLLPLDMDAKSGSAVFPSLDLRMQAEIDAESAPPEGFVSHSGVTQQIYRFIVSRGKKGTTSQDIRAELGYFYSTKEVHVVLQILIKSFDITSIADQTGKSMMFKFFTREAFEEFKRDHIGGGGSDKNATVKDSDHGPLDGSPAAAASAAAPSINDVPGLPPLPKRSIKGATAMATAAQQTKDLSNRPLVPLNLSNAVAPVLVEEFESTMILPQPKSKSYKKKPDSSTHASPSAKPAPSPSESARPISRVTASSPTPTAATSGSSSTTSTTTTTHKSVSANRATLKTVQREQWVLEALRASPHGILRAVDVARYLLEKETGESSGLNTVNAKDSIAQKSCVRIYNRLSSHKPPRIKQINIAIPSKTSARVKTVLVLTLPEIDVTGNPEHNSQAIEVAKTIYYTEKQRNSTRLGGSKKKKRKREDTDESEGEGSAPEDQETDEAHDDVEDDEEYAAAAMGLTVPPPLVPASATRKVKHSTSTKTASVKKEPQTHASDVSDISEDEGAGGVMNTELFYPLTHGFIRPRVARMRFLMERLWSDAYSRIDPNVEYIDAKKKQAAVKPASEAPSVQPSPTPSPAPASSTASMISNVLAAAAAATSSASTPSPAVPLTMRASPPSPILPGIPRSVDYTSFTESMLLRDWLSVIGLRDDDCNESHATILLGSEMNFDRPVNDPLLAPWTNKIVQHQRTRKMVMLRKTFRELVELGFLSDGTRSGHTVTQENGELTIEAGRQYYILEPTIHLLGDNMDLRTVEGRDAAWKLIRDQCIAIYHRQRAMVPRGGGNQDTSSTSAPMDLSTDLAPLNTHSPNMPALETHSGELAADVDMLPPAAVNSSAAAPSSSKSKKGKGPPSVQAIRQTLPALSNEPIMQQFPFTTFQYLYRKRNWIMGRPLDQLTMDEVEKVTPPIGDPPLSAAAIIAVHKAKFSQINRSMLCCYLAQARYSFARDAFDRLQLADIGTRAIFPYGGRLAGVAAKRGRPPGSTAHRASRSPSMSSVAGAAPTSPATTARAVQSPKQKKYTLIRIPRPNVDGPAAQGQKDTPAQPAPQYISDTPAQPAPQYISAADTERTLKAHHDSDHIPQPIDAPLRRSTSQEAAKPKPVQQQLDEDAESSSDEEEPSPSAVTPAAAKPSLGLNRSSTATPLSPARKRATSTRVRWTPEEDQQLVQVFNEWFLRVYTPAQIEAASNQPKQYVPGGEQHKNKNAAGAQLSVNAFAAEKMRGRDAAACRRRLEVLRNKGLLPTVASAGPVASTIRSLSTARLQAEVFGSPALVSLMHMMELLFSHPFSQPFPSELAMQLITHFSDKQIDTVLKVLKDDKWITATKSNDNQMGRSWKFAAGWTDLLKPQGISGEVFAVNREFQEPFMQLSSSNLLAPVSSPAAPIAEHPHLFTAGPTTRGGEIAAILHFLSTGEVQLRPRIVEMKENGDNDVLMVDVESIPQLKTWLPGSDLPPTPPPAPASSASASAPPAPGDASSSLSQHFLFRKHYPSGHAFPSLLKFGPFAANAADLNPSAELGEEFLLPLGPPPAEDDEDVVMIDAEATTAAPATPAATAPAAASSSSSSAPMVVDTLAWMDTPEVIAAQHVIEQLVETAGSDGVSLPVLLERFVASQGAQEFDLASCPYSLSLHPLQPNSSMFEKALARAMNYLNVIKVMEHEPTPRFAHARFSSIWSVATFNESFEADFKDTAILPHPWREIQGGVNQERLQAFLDSIMSLLLDHPGMTPSALSRHLPHIPPSELEHCIQHLIMEERVKIRTAQKETPSLFSQPFGLKRDTREKKRRKVEGQVTKERYLFPTTQAFAL